MFFNRAIQVKVVKTNGSEQSDLDPAQIAELVHLAQDTAVKVAIGAGIFLGAYIVLDTLRQVTVKIVEAKL